MVTGFPCVQVRSKLPPGVDGWGYSLKGLMGMVVIGGFLITATYFLLQRTVVPRSADPFTIYTEPQWSTSYTVLSCGHSEPAHAKGFL